MRNMRKLTTNAHFQFIRIIWKWFFFQLFVYFEKYKVENKLTELYFNTLTAI